MQRLFGIALIVVLACGVGGAKSHGSGHSGRSSTPTSSHSHGSYKAHSSSKCYGCSRDKHGKIKRSGEARNAFKHSHPCPSTGKSSGSCPGYVIDHVRPLSKGGADDPSNMQWQTNAAAKQKDKWERK
jgi:hypothetical protein